MDQEHFEIINKEIQTLLRDIGKTIGSKMPKNFGFTLMIFSYIGPELFYLSSANREDMITTLYEFINKLKTDSSKANRS